PFLNRTALPGVLPPSRSKTGEARRFAGGPLPWVRGRAFAGAGCSSATDSRWPTLLLSSALRCEGPPDACGHPGAACSTTSPSQPVSLSGNRQEDHGAGAVRFSGATFPLILR